MTIFKVEAGETIGVNHLSKLRHTAGPGPVLILTHDNPDPDALASGKALAFLLDAWKISSKLVYSGIIGRSENRAMLRLLTPEWRHQDILPNSERFSATVLVDSQPNAGNNRLPADRPPDIVIDHHFETGDFSGVRYKDVRPNIGATTTMIYQYLICADLEPDSRLATAMFYGLKTDTRGLSRDAGRVDEDAYLRLLSLMDRESLIQVEQAGLSRTYFRDLYRGLQSAKLHGHAVFASLGEIIRPDLVAEMADLLIRLDDAKVVLCIGQFRNQLYLSLRTGPLRQDAGYLIQKIVPAPGKAGGHGTMAGGQYPLNQDDPAVLVDDIRRRFLAYLDESDREGEFLVV